MARTKYYVIERVGDRSYIASTHYSYERAQQALRRYERLYDERNPISGNTREDISYRIVER